MNPLNSYLHMSSFFYSAPSLVHQMKLIWTIFRWTPSTHTSRCRLSSSQFHLWFIRWSWGGQSLDEPTSTQPSRCRLSSSQCHLCFFRSWAGDNLLMNLNKSLLIFSCYLFCYYFVSKYRTNKVEWKSIPQFFYSVCKFDLQPISMNVIIIQLIN